MSVDASTRLNKMLDTSSEIIDKAGDKGINIEESERPLTINSQPRFSSTNGHKSQTMKSVPKMGLINIRPIH